MLTFNQQNIKMNAQIQKIILYKKILKKKTLY